MRRDRRLFDLPPRLRWVADRVPPHARFADIGSDHGRLPVWMLRQGKVDHAVITDLREGPLATARKTAERFGVKDRATFLCCDGLCAVPPGSVTHIAICGMGGGTIAAILEAAPWALDATLLLQPMSSAEELRAYLFAHSAEIIEDQVVSEDGRFYTALSVAGRAPTPYPWTLADCYIGRETAMEALPPLYMEKFLKHLRRSAEGKLQRGEADGPALRRAVEEIEARWKNGSHRGHFEKT